ncbi:MAG: DUF1564 family protein [Leptospiraceae bacterium]|nr:DUF1564 family protein [Leptospiraceae bacterium]
MSYFHPPRTNSNSSQKGYDRTNHPYRKFPRLTGGRVQAPIASKDGSTTSLLIPFEMLGYFQMRIEQFGAIKYYFQHLLFVYGFHLDIYKQEPHHKGCKKLYQEAGQGYKRFDFKAAPVEWEQMRNLSYMYGPSICWMFVHLMQLEEKRWISAGKPDFFLESAPPRPKSPQDALNSNKRSKKAHETLLQAIMDSSARTITVRIMDQPFRNLTRFGEIRL